MYVGAGLFTQFRNFINKANFCGKKGVSCVLSDLRTFKVGDKDGSLDQIEGTVELA